MTDQAIPVSLPLNLPTGPELLNQKYYLVEKMMNLLTDDLINNEQISQFLGNEINQFLPHLKLNLFENPASNPFNSEKFNRIAKVTKNSVYASDASAFLPESNSQFRLLSEEILNQANQVTPVTPLQQTMLIKDPASFILGNHLSQDSDNAGFYADKDIESLEIYCFSQPEALCRTFDRESPGGDRVFEILFSLIKQGRLPGWCRADQFTFRLVSKGKSPSKAGYLNLKKASGVTLTVKWELKGLTWNDQKKMSSASLFLYVSQKEEINPDQFTEELLGEIPMPIQSFMGGSAGLDLAHPGEYRVFTIHHRTPEVVRTLWTLHKLGYVLDSFIGIPYGEVSWGINRMSDAASNHTFITLKGQPDSKGISTYSFDFKASSFLSAVEEADFRNLFPESDTAANTDFTTAMGTLIEYSLQKSLNKCKQYRQRLVLYEDGGYAVPIIYRIYNSPDHPLHNLIKWAVESGAIAGVVEVTASGERKNRAAIEANQGRALLPVLTCARDDVKTIYESIGVAESVIQAAANALGRLGLATFEHRQIAILGGNGAIGTRLVEQLSLAHKSTSHIFSVDTTEKAFNQTLPNDTLPFIATKASYINLPRYSISEQCLPLVVDQPLKNCKALLELAEVKEALAELLNPCSRFDELAIKARISSNNSQLNRFVAYLASFYGYHPTEMKALPSGAGTSWVLTNNQGKEKTKKLTLLVPDAVFNFNTVNFLLRNHLDTIIGVTGQAVMIVKNFDTFLRRTPQTHKIDELILVSGSSKDWEFSQVKNFLNKLQVFLSSTPPDQQTQLEWLSEMYHTKLMFLDDSEVDEILKFALAAFLKKQGFSQQDKIAGELNLSRVLEYLRYKISGRISIRKEVRADIGSIYHITIDGVKKRLVLVSDGFVVNFYSRHEKGVKTEYMDPIMTMQLLGVVRLTNESKTISPGLHSLNDNLKESDRELLWQLLDEQSRPLTFKY